VNLLRLIAIASYEFSVAALTLNVALNQTLVTWFKYCVFLFCASC